MVVKSVVVIGLLWAVGSSRASDASEAGHASQEVIIPAYLEDELQRAHVSYCVVVPGRENTLPEQERLLEDLRAAGIPVPGPTDCKPVVLIFTSGGIGDRVYRGFLQGSDLDSDDEDEGDRRVRSQDARDNSDFAEDGDAPFIKPIFLETGGNAEGEVE